MDSDWTSFLSRDEVLNGLPARRASTLLFAIESRTAQLVARSRRALATYRTERTAEADERAFLDALSGGRDLPFQPTVQDLERYAPEWASLVPMDASVRAALARMIGQKYLIPVGRVRGIANALGLDDPAVGERYQSLYGTPISSVYAGAPSARERWRWFRAAVSARLESLPPFWTAFALTLTETVGAGILALPIAFAAVGPVAGVVVLVVLGLINMLTIAAMAEAVARHGGVRYGRAYFGRMVGDYLGRSGTMILTPTLLLMLVIVQLAYFIGFSSTLADATGVAAPFWAGALVLVVLFFLLREGLNATVASAFVVGGATISLIVTLSIMALPHVTGANLRHAQIPFRNDQPFDRTILELVFGVVLFAYFGHTSTINCAAVVLEKDPSGRSLIHGCAAGLAAALGLYSLWVVAVNGAVPATALAGERGTALIPLADYVGAQVHVIGIVFVTLAIGMASIHQGLGLSYQVREWLPGSPPRWMGWAGTRWQTVAGVAPVVMIFGAVELLFLAERESFSKPLGFLGAIAAPIVAGVFSMLMLFASRRKGDLEVAGNWRLIGSPVVVGAVCSIFLASIVVHGLFVWDDPVRRTISLLVALGIIVFAVTIRRTAFVPRGVIHVRLSAQPDVAPIIAVVAGGSSVPVDVDWTHDGQISRDGNGRHAVVHIPALPVRELKV